MESVIVIAQQIYKVDVSYRCTGYLQPSDGKRKSVRAAVAVAAGRSRFGGVDQRLIVLVSSGREIE